MLLQVGCLSFLCVFVLIVVCSFTFFSWQPLWVLVDCYRDSIITPCACAAGGRVIGLSVSLSVCPQSKRGLSSEGLVEGLFQDRSARIQKILAST